MYLSTKIGLLVTGAAAGAVAMTGFGRSEVPAPALAETTIAAASVQQIPPLRGDNIAGFSFADVVEQVSPAVVSVLVERSVELPGRVSPLPPGFERFFGFPGLPDSEEDPFEEEGTRRAEAQGSGFFVDANGHIVTNHHVVEDAEVVRVRLSDGTELDATVVGSDQYTDLAVLKVKSNPKQPFVTFAPDADLRVGDWVVAVGNPFGLGGTVTSGIVSAIGGQNREQQYVDLIQVDAAINRGNSGGPAFDLKGRVIGVNVAIYSPNGGNVGIGFAIPAETAKATVDQLIEKGAVTRGWLGISLDRVTPDLAEALELDSTDGVLVAEVLADTPAAAGGLQDGDVITSVDGRAVEGPNDLSRRIGNFPPGRKIKLVVVRDGARKNLSVTLGERDSELSIASAPSAPDASTAEELGVRVSAITDALRTRYRLDETATGVVVTGVKPGSPAERTGLTPGRGHYRG